MRRGVVRFTILMLWLALVWHGMLAAPPQQENLYQLFLQNLRADIELLADRVFGGTERPDGWTGSDDLSAAVTVADLWFDNELLADAVFDSLRPPSWIGATSSDASLVARGIRHDLELSADVILGRAQRPPEWLGASPVYRCDRALQNVLYLLDRQYELRPQTPDTALNYCAAVQAEVEDQLLTQALAAWQLPLTEAEATAQSAQVPEQILAVRGDLERLADETQGLNSRPDGWVGNRELASPTLAADIFADLERLADAVAGIDQRPDGWIGAISTSPVVSLRNLRFDLELLSDVSLGAGARPRGWQGQDPLSRCDPLTQTLALLAQQSIALDLAALPAEADYCQQVLDQANALVENPASLAVEDVAEDTQFMAQASYSFAYLDPAATQYMGMIPDGTAFRAWYRNFGESTMMFVSGEDFALFIDRRWTSMTDRQFESLPTLEGVAPLSFCDATWCDGPSPTPTPTGVSPLLAIISGATPPATQAAPAPLDGEAVITQVNWNHIRITYLLQRPELSAAQVTLEICREVAQIACEPVTSIVDNTSGQPYPVISQFNGLNVYEIGYGYTDNLVIQGATLFSPDIWLNDPALSGG